MAKNVLPKILNFVIWLTGIIVSLAVGFAMIAGTLSVPVWLGGDTLAMIAGWVVIFTTFLSVILAVVASIR